MIATIPGFAELTLKQRAAVEHRGGNLLVEAVPGSGKTRVIIARCAALLAQGIAPATILLLTFSQRAVGELRSRLAELSAGGVAPDVHTFHGFAARLLAESGSGGHSRWLLSEPAMRTVFERAVESTPLRSLPAAAVAGSHFRAAAAVRVDELHRASPAALARLAALATPRIADLLALDAEQQQLRDRLGAADFDDLVAQCVRLAALPGGRVAATVRERYTHVLVDEFQDCDPLQLALLERFTAEIFAVGDASQAIYGFRGAARDALAQARRILSMTTVSLDESFRCPAPVCELARSVWPSPPLLQSRAVRPAALEFRRAVSPQDEAVAIAEAVVAALAGGTSEREIAVLVRSAEPLARLVDRELRARGVMVARHGGGDVLDDLAVDAICTALRVFARPGQPARWLELLGHPVFGLAPLPLRLAFAAAPPASIAAACALADGLTGDSRVPGPRLARALRCAQVHWDAGDPLNAARAFAAEADVLGFVVAGGENEARSSAQRLSTFLAGLGEVRDLRARLGMDASPSAVIGALLDGGHAWSADSDALDEQPGVRVLTVHAAKGLEFAFVVIADAVDARFPQPLRVDGLLAEDELALARECGVDLGTRDEERLAEERSLWYVAVTRSKRTLLITWSETDLDGSPQRPSRFIPLAARTAEAQQPSFRAPLTYAPPTLVEPQPAAVSRLVRSVATSSMQTWLNCRRKFYYGELLKLGSREGGLRAKLGKLVHAAIQQFHAGVRDFRAVAPGAHAAWATALADLAEAILASWNEPPLAFDSELEAASALRAARRLLDRYARALEAAARSGAGGFEVVAVEERVDYCVEGVTFSGRIDRIDRLADGTLQIVDIKTSAFKRDRAMADAFVKLADAVRAETLWVKETPPANPQLALYRHAKSPADALAYVYLEARPKPGEYADAARTDRLETDAGAGALGAIDAALAATFFEPWSSGTVATLEPTRFARACRSCEFVTVCPGYLEDDE